MSEFRLKAVELATSLGHKAAADLVASAHAIEQFILKGVGEVESVVNKKAAKTATVAAASLPATTPAASETTTAPAVDLDAIRKAMVKMISKNLRSQITETFAEFGAQDASSLKPANYAAVLQKFNDFLAVA